MKKAVSLLCLISVVLVVGVVVINTIQKDKPVEYASSEEAEKQKGQYHFMDLDNTVYLYSDAVEGYRSPVHGTLAFNWELSSWLSRDDLPEDQVFRIFIRAFSSDEYDVFISKGITELRNKYIGIEDTSPPVNKELHRQLQVSSLRIYIEGYEKWIKPVLDQAADFGLVFEEKYIDFVISEDNETYNEREVYTTKMYLVAYADRCLIERLCELVEGKEYGITIDLAPSYVDYESATVSFDDPFFSH